MTKITMLGLLVLAIGITTIPVLAEMQTPLQQFKSGIPIDEIQCNYSKTLLESPSGKPACVNEDSVEKLEGYGWTVIIPQQITKDFKTELSLNDNVVTEYFVSNGDEMIDIQNTSHKSGDTNHVDPITTFSFPKTVDIGNTFIINYTYTWVEPDEDNELHEINDFMDIDDPFYTENNYELVVWLPDEFSVVSSTSNVTSYNFLADDYVDHVLKMHRILVPYDFTKTNQGSIEFQLDKEIMYDEDFLMVFERHDSNDEVSGFFILKQDNGVSFVSEKSLGRFFDLAYNSETYRYTNSLISDNPFGDYTPLPRPEPKVAGASDEPFYIDKQGWSTFVEFLRDVQIDTNPSNMTQWLLEQNLTQKFVDDFMVEYPEFRTQSAGGTVSGQASAPTSIFVSGNFKINDRVNSRVGVDGVNVCLYDVNLSTTQRTLLYNGQTPICDFSRSNGYFSLNGINDDPNDNTNVDFKVGFLLSNDKVVIKNPEGTNTIKYFHNETEKNASQRIYLLGNISVGSSLQQHYLHFDDINKAHKKIKSDVRYTTPLVTILYTHASDPEYEHTPNHSQDNTIIVGNTISGTNLASIKNYPSIILHEYGHHIQHNVYRDNNSVIPPCSTHNINT